MSERERWIVYPLLFLTLGIALRNQFFPTRRFGAVDLRAGELSAQRIRCNALVVNDKADCREMKCDSLAGSAIKAHRAECRVLNVVNEKGRPLVTAGEELDSRSGLIQTSDPQGVPQVQIRSTDSGGMVTAFGHQGKVLVEIGHEGQAFGVFAQYPPSPPFLLPAAVPEKTKSTPAPSSRNAAPARKPVEKKEDAKSSDRTP